MNLADKPCRVCGLVDRYNDKKMRCRPCTQKKQKERNQSYRLPKHIAQLKRQEENRLIKQAAIDAGHHIYESKTPCSHCGELMRYVCNGACIACN